MRRKCKDATDLQTETLLRSINIVYDSDQPERVAHFRPTTKSVALLRALAGNESDKATIVVAPYGTGKSIAATYLLHVVENTQDTRRVLRPADQRLMAVSPELGSWVKRRRRAGRRGLVIALSGHQSSLGASVREATLAGMTRLKLGRQARSLRRLECASVEEIIEFLAVLQEKCASAKIDRIVIVWDEFGRHLEALLAESRADKLHEIQTLAEYVSRTSACPMTLGLLLHRRLIHYAGTCSQAIRQEWQKIEGRFATLQYVDDSKEIYRLIAEFVGSRFSDVTISAREAKRQAKAARNLGLLAEFGFAELSELLRSSYPLDPVALALLPRFASRISQNERTLFSFLSSITSENSLGTADLYDYFAPAMQVDTGVGGTHKQWLETESALTKANDFNESCALKCACILGIGTAGGRARAPRALLGFAMASYARDGAGDSALSSLIERKLLLHRKHNDEISVWHGADVDLRGRLDEERDRQQGRFDLLKFLQKESPAPVWRPVEYNSEFSVRRFLRGEYHTLYSLDRYLGLDLDASALPSGVDGKVLYILPSNAEDVVQASRLAQSQLQDPQLVIAVCPEIGGLQSTALELHCLQILRTDSELLATDPLVDAELSQMLDGSRAQLAKLMDRVSQPGAGGPRWFFHGKEFDASNRASLVRELSQIMRVTFSRMPVFNNEMIVRARPSAVIVNARKKLNLGILERTGMERLGLTGNFPDSSMFRSILLNSGLYRESGDGSWRYAAPEELECEKLRDVWSSFQDFVSIPSQRPKEPSEFFEKLKAPPIGLREGVIPILLAAAFRAFPSALSVTCDGRYVDDVLPSTIEEICKNPARYLFDVRPLNSSQRHLLVELIRVFGGDGADLQAADRARVLFDAIVQWRIDLPRAARTTRALSEVAMKLRDMVYSFTDPLRLVTEDLPRLAPSFEIVELIERAKTELEGVTKGYQRQARAAVIDTLRIPERSQSRKLSVVVAEWARCFSDDLLSAIPEGIGRGLVRQLQARFSDDAALLDRLAGLVLGRPFAKWDDSCPAQFARRFGDSVREVESRVLHAASASTSSQGQHHELSRLARGRVVQLVEQSRRVLGEEETKQLLLELASFSQGEASGYNR